LAAAEKSRLYMCARVLKAKYFANSSVIDAMPKSNMSYTWRSILRGLEVIKKGMIWRVGDGNNLHIWQDPWLPRGVFRRPITPRGACLLTYVSELINPSSWDWDVELVKRIFWEEDVKVILALPVHEGRDNLIAWHYDNHG